MAVPKKKRSIRIRRRRRSNQIKLFLNKIFKKNHKNLIKREFKFIV